MRGVGDGARGRSWSSAWVGRASRGRRRGRRGIVGASRSSSRATGCWAGSVRWTRHRRVLLRETEETLTAADEAAPRRPGGHCRPGRSSPQHGLRRAAVHSWSTAAAACRARTCGHRHPAARVVDAGAATVPRGCCRGRRPARRNQSACGPTGATTTSRRRRRCSCQTPPMMDERPQAALRFACQSPRTPSSRPSTAHHGGPQPPDRDARQAPVAATHRRHLPRPAARRRAYPERLRMVLLRDTQELEPVVRRCEATPCSPTSTASRSTSSGPRGAPVGAARLADRAAGLRERLPGAARGHRLDPIDPIVTLKKAAAG